MTLLSHTCKSCFRLKREQDLLLPPPISHSRLKREWEITLRDNLKMQEIELVLVLRERCNFRLPTLHRLV